MKKITLLLITLFATGMMLMAQGGPRGSERGHRNPKAVNIKERAERMSEQMAKEYTLNETQKRQVYEANLIMMADMQPSHKGERCPHCGKPGFDKTPGFDKKRGSDQKMDTARIAKRDGKDMKAKREEKMTEMKQSREAYEAKIKSILTKEQYSTYTKNQDERRKRMEERKAAKNQDVTKG